MVPTTENELGNVYISAVVSALDDHEYNFENAPYTSVTVAE
jgi:hypothetical protein